MTKIKTAPKNSVNYFNLLLQNSQDTVVHVVCFSPEKRNLIKEKQLQQLPVRFDDIAKSPSKRKAGEDDYTIRKSAKFHQPLLILNTMKHLMTTI